MLKLKRRAGRKRENVNDEEERKGKRVRQNDKKRETETGEMWRKQLNGMRPRKE